MEGHGKVTDEVIFSFTNPSGLGLSFNMILPRML